MRTSLTAAICLTFCHCNRCFKTSTFWTPTAFSAPACKVVSSRVKCVPSASCIGPVTSLEYTKRYLGYKQVCTYCDIPQGIYITQQSCPEIPYPRYDLMYHESWEVGKRINLKNHKHQSKSTTEYIPDCMVQTWFIQKKRLPVWHIILLRSDRCLIQSCEWKRHQVWPRNQLCDGVCCCNSYWGWATLWSWVAASKVERKLSQSHGVHPCMHLHICINHVFHLRLTLLMVKAFCEYNSGETYGQVDMLHEREVVALTPMASIQLLVSNSLWGKHHIWNSYFNNAQIYKISLITWERRCNSKYSAARTSPPSDIER